MSDTQALETTVSAKKQPPVEGSASESLRAAAIEAAYILEAVRK